MTTEQFADWWLTLKNQLGPGKTIHHWSVTGRQESGSFLASVPPMYPECVVVEGPQRTHIYQRMIFTSDFRAVLNIWIDYRRGLIPRRRVDERTKHSTYVLSIIHWLEETTK